MLHSAKTKGKVGLKGRRRGHRYSLCPRGFFFKYPVKKWVFFHMQYACETLILRRLSNYRYDPQYDHELLKNMKQCCARVPWKMSLNVRMLPLFFLEGYLCFLVAITFGFGAVKMKSMRKNAKLWLIEYYWMALQSNRYTKNVYHLRQDLSRSEADYLSTSQWGNM